MESWLTDACEMRPVRQVGLSRALSISFRPLPSGSQDKVGQVAPSAAAAAKPVAGRYWKCLIDGLRLFGLGLGFGDVLKIQTGAVAAGTAPKHSALEKTGTSRVPLVTADGR